METARFRACSTLERLFTFENRDPLKGDGNLERLFTKSGRSLMTLKTETRLKGMETYQFLVSLNLPAPMDRFENRDPLKGDGNSV